MINDNKNEVENSPVVNSPPVNSPDQIRPNLTLTETLTLTQVGIHPGGGGVDHGGIFRSPLNPPTTDPPTTFHLPTDTPICRHHFG